MVKKATTAKKRTAQETEREAANREGEAGREKAQKARQANAGKQKRYRESMKAQGYHAVLTWEKPLPPDMVKVSAIIHKSSLGIADREDKETGRFIKDLWDFVLIHRREMPKDLYQDILNLVKPLGDGGF
ncbi:MAG: hypothetical protein LBQ88_09420 [Treponema sp.]|jgi:hypothetical protein|nr:hypothetical protein [Treponema sp.]